MSSKSLVKTKEKKEQGTCMSAKFLAQFNAAKKKRKKMYPYEYRLQNANRTQEELDASTEEKTKIELINIGYLKMFKAHRRRIIEATIVQRCWRQSEPEPKRKKRKKKKQEIEPLPELIVEDKKLETPFYFA